LFGKRKYFSMDIKFKTKINEWGFSTPVKFSEMEICRFGSELFKLILSGFSQKLGCCNQFKSLNCDPFYYSIAFRALSESWIWITNYYRFFNALVTEPVNPERLC